MEEGIMASFARLFGFGKRDKSIEMPENKETGSFAGDLERKIGNHGTNEQLKGESEIELPEKANMEEPKENTQPEDTQQKDNITQEKSIEALYTKLQTSKRGGFHLHSGNSVFYNQVMSSMSDIIDAMKQQFSTDTLSNLKQFDDMQAKYQKLINACEAYLNRRALSYQGQIRKGIVKNILETAQKDLIGLGNISMEFAYLPPEEQAGKSWAGIVDNARVTQLSVDNLFGIDREKKGEASEVLKLDSNKVTISRKDETVGKLSGTYYFKPEDEIDLEQITYASQMVNNVISRYPDLKPHEKKLIRNWVAEATELETDSDEQTFPDKPDGLSQQGELALETIKMKARTAKKIYDNQLLANGIADEGGRINMTKRNVATSRVAALLGLEHLVAKSYTAELFDNATGQKVKGNMMEKAEGMGVTAFGLQRDKNISSSTPAAINNLVQRDILNLQVLDVLCGQIDRNMGNILLQTEDDTITGIKGIDNDASFGLNIDVVSNKQGFGERRDRRVYNPNTGELVLPYMDKNLANRIMELNPDMLRFSLKGLITDREIEAAVQRLTMMKTAIENAGEEHFLEDSQWNQKTAQMLFEHGNSMYNTSDERRKECDNMIFEMKPYLNKSRREYSEEEEKEFVELREQIIPTLKNKYEEIACDRDNYFYRVLLATMTCSIWGGILNVPQLEVKNPQE